MIDINNIISLALTSAINKAIEPLLERIDTLEKNEEALVRRIAVLETNPAGTPATITADAFVTHLDNQEWFWEKLTRKAHEAAEAVVEEAMDSHCSDYDHDDYNQVSSNLSNYDLDDFVTNDNLEEAVNDVLKNATVSISI